MLRVLVLSALLAPGAVALPSLSGTVRDSSNGPIDGAKATIWDSATGKSLQTFSSKGLFSWGQVTEAEYLFKVGSNGWMPGGAVRLSGDGPREINVVMVTTARGTVESVGAGAALRDAVLPPRDPSKQSKVIFPKEKKKVKPVYPEAARRAGVGGTVKIATIILPDGTLDDLVVLSAPSGDLAVAALVAARQWRYSPAYRDGEGIETSLTIDIKFDR
jgi:TonB family protein